MVRVFQPGILLLASLMWLGVAWGVQRGGFRGGGAHVGGGFHSGGGRGMHGHVGGAPGFRGGVQLGPSHPFHSGPQVFVRPFFPNRGFQFFAPGFHSRFVSPHFRFFFGSRFFGFGTPFFGLGTIPIATFPWAPFTDFSYYGFPSYSAPSATGPPPSQMPYAGEQRVLPSPLPGAAPSVARPGILAFKDGTRVGVVDYWLQGDQVYYLNAEGVQGSAPIDSLDLPATQQLNRARGLTFVLESRP